MPRLFTASDVERAARLAAQHVATCWRDWGRVSDPSPENVEAAVHEATFVIADDSPPFYSEEDVIHILQFVLEREDVEAEFEDAVATALRR